MQSTQRRGRKRRLRVGDTAWVRLTPTVPGVERIVRRLNQEPNVSDFIRRLILEQIEREEHPTGGSALDPNVLTKLVSEVVHQLNGQQSAGTLQTRPPESAPPAQPEEPAEQLPPATPPPPATSRTARGRDQLHRLLAED